MEKSKKELLEEMFPEVAKALEAIVDAGCPMDEGMYASDIGQPLSTFCYYCGEEYGHDDDNCAFSLAREAWFHLHDVDVPLPE